MDNSNHKEILEKIDGSVRGSLEGILGAPLTQNQWNQASLPVAMGELGLRQARSHGAAAYLSSIGELTLLVQEIRQQQEPQGPEVVNAMADLNDQLGDPITFEELSILSQRSLSVMIDKETSNKLHQVTVVVRDQARLNCVEREGAGDWLNAIPSKNMGLHLKNSEFIFAVQYRLGIQVFTEEMECPMP